MRFEGLECPAFGGELPASEELTGGVVFAGGISASHWVGRSSYYRSYHYGKEA